MPFLCTSGLIRVALAALAAVGALLAEPAQASRRVALVVGISQYQHVPKLPNPTNDATDIAAKLTSLGFDVVTGFDLDFRGWREVLQTFERKAMNADAALFFYAGHAMQFQGQNYLMPTTATLKDETSLIYDMVSVNEIKNLFARARAAVRIMVLDACRNNPLASELARSQTGATRSLHGPTRGLARIDKAEGMVIVYATAADEVAEDGKAARNSPFTSALLERMDEPGLEIATLFRRVQGDVMSRTANRQRPEISIALASEFYLNTAETDTSAWVRVRQSRDAGQIRAFIEKYPRSAHLDDAKFMVDVIDRDQRVQRDLDRRRLADEEARVAAEAARRQAEEQAQRQQAEARRRAEEQEQQRQAETRRQAEEQARRQQAEEARRQAEEQAQRQQAEARRRAEEQEQQRQAETRRQAEEQARRQQAEAARRQAEEQAQRQQAEARRRAEEQDQQRQAEARRQAEEQARRQQAAQAAVPSRPADAGVSGGSRTGETQVAMNVPPPAAVAVPVPRPAAPDAARRRQLEEEAKVSIRRCLADTKAINIKASPREVEAMLAVDVRMQIQQFLSHRGYFDGAVNGDFAAPTRTAIRRFQAAMGGQQTGYLTFCELLVLRATN